MLARYAYRAIGKDKNGNARKFIVDGTDYVDALANARWLHAEYTFDSLDVEPADATDQIEIDAIEIGGAK